MKTAKAKYIAAYLDGFFSDKKVSFGMRYYSMLNNAIIKAKKQWNSQKKKPKS